MKKRIKLYIYIITIMGFLVGYAQQKLDYSSCYENYEFGTSGYDGCISNIDAWNKRLEDQAIAIAMEIGENLQSMGMTQLTIQAQIQTIDLPALQALIQASVTQALAAQYEVEQAQQALAQAQQKLDEAHQELFISQEIAAATGQIPNFNATSMIQAEAAEYTAEAERHAQLATQQYNYAISQGNTSGSSTITWYMDNDKDGWHSASRESSTCPGPQWTSTTTKGLDCNDGDSTKTYDCSGTLTMKAWFLDKDGDGYFAAVQMATTSPGAGWIAASTKGPDCDDHDEFTPSIFSCPDCEIPNFQCRPGEILNQNCDCVINLDDPCANKDLMNKEVSPEVVSMINARKQPNTMVQSSQMVSSFILETVDDGWGDVNQDKYSMNVTNLPSGYTPFQLFNEIRSNFDELMVGGNIPYLTDVDLEPYSPADGITWDSDNPVGAAMNFHTMFDTSTVYCVEYNAEEMYWVFATVTSYDHQGHFVAGLRQFGLEPNANGGHSFYLRAADRLGGVLDYIANGLSGDEEALFVHAGDATWKNFMENLVGFVQRIGGSADEFDSDKTYGKRYPYDPDDCP